VNLSQQPGTWPSQFSRVPPVSCISKTASPFGTGRPEQPPSEHRLVAALTATAATTHRSRASLRRPEIPAGRTPPWQVSESCRRSSRSNTSREARDTASAIRPAFDRGSIVAPGTDGPQRSGRLHSGVCRWSPCLVLACSPLPETRYPQIPITAVPADEPPPVSVSCGAPRRGQRAVKLPAAEGRCALASDPRFTRPGSVFSSDFQRPAPL